MSVVSNGILRMPPECWSGDVLDVAQRHAAYRNAADLIDELTAALRLARGYVANLTIPQDDKAGVAMLVSGAKLLDVLDEALQKT